ncbi:MAG: WG repeat-containing protein [Moraxella sp.]|nr:WG repeat-containing protein [Moraxella sp.]
MKNLLLVLSLLAMNAYACSNECELDIAPEDCELSEELCVTFIDYDTYTEGFRDKTGKITVPAIYGNIQIRNGIAIVQKDGFYGILNKSGKIITPIIYENIAINEKGMMIGKNSQFFLINEQGKQISKPYTHLRDISDIEDKAIFCEMVNNEILCGIIDSLGKIIVSAKYHRIELLTNHNGYHPKFVAVSNDKNKFAVLDIDKAQTITPFIYDEIGHVSDGLIIVKLNGKYGFIDGTGKQVITPIYDNVAEYGFKYGLAIVEKDGERFYIDKTGKKVP